MKTGFNNHLLVGSFRMGSYNLLWGLPFARYWQSEVYQDIRQIALDCDPKNDCPLLPRTII